MTVSRAAKVASIVGALYGLAWIISFLLVAGTDFRLIPEYFVLGWTLSGLELVAFQWLLALIIFVLFLVVIWTVERRRRRSSSSI